VSKYFLRRVDFDKVQRLELTSKSSLPELTSKSELIEQTGARELFTSIDPATPVSLNHIVDGEAFAFAYSSDSLWGFLIPLTLEAMERLLQFAEPIN